MSEIPQWCRDAAEEIWSMGFTREEHAAIIAKHAPQRLPSAAERAERMYGYKPTGLNTIDALAAEGFYEATTPNNYACDPTHGSYLPEASGVERFTVKELWYGNDDNKLVVTAADHDRIVAELRAQLAAANERAKNAEAEFAKLEAILKSSCEDAAEDDTAIREMLRPHITPYEVDGDSWSVPSIPTVVESFVKTMVNRIAALEHERDGLREALLKAKAYVNSQWYQQMEREILAVIDAALSQPKGGE